MRCLCPHCHRPLEIGPNTSPGLYRCAHCPRVITVGRLPPLPQSKHDGAAIGAIGGAAIGAAVGGPGGALLGGLLGLLLGAKAVAITAITTGGGVFFGAILVLTPFIEKLQGLSTRPEYPVIAGVAVLWVSVQYGWSLWAGRATATAEDVPTPLHEGCNGPVHAGSPKTSAPINREPAPTPAPPPKKN